MSEFYVIDTIYLIWFQSKLNENEPSSYRETCNCAIENDSCTRIPDFNVARSYEMNQLIIDSYKMSYIMLLLPKYHEGEWSLAPNSKWSLELYFILLQTFYAFFWRGFAVVLEPIFITLFLFFSFFVRSNGEKKLSCRARNLSKYSSSKCLWY